MPEAPAPVKMAKIEKIAEKVRTSEEAESTVKKEATAPLKVSEEKKDKPKVAVPDKPYEEMTVEELQEAILAKMAKNGPVTDYMLGTVRENTHHGSLVTWVKSFN